jgi:hypothetical protein
MNKEYLIEIKMHPTASSPGKGGGNSKTQTLMIDSRRQGKSLEPLETTPYIPH